jgi:tRNA 2-thiouridine synthesizing protein D
MPKSLTLFLSSTPYGGENAHTALQLARAALAKGHQVTVFASGDGVHAFQVNQGARGIPNAGAEFEALIEQGLRVELCGSCLRFRGLGAETVVPGAAPSSLEGLFRLLNAGDAFVTLGG